METKVSTTVGFTVSLELTEREARAFDALIGYGFKPFIEVFYAHLGRHYLEPYEKDLKAIFERRQELNFQLYNIGLVRKQLKTINTNPGLDYEMPPLNDIEPVE